MTMQVETRELNPCTIEMTVKCSPEQVRAGFEKAFRQASKQVKVPGFRPGAAPKAVLKNYVNEDWVRDRAEEIIMNDVYPKAVKEKELKVAPRAQAQLTTKTFDPDADKFEFVVKVPLESRVELGEYKHLEAQKPDAQVTDEDVENFIHSMRERRATREKVEDRGAQEGDFAVVNLKPDGDEGDGRTFMAVVGQTFPQLDQLLMGMKVEESKLETLTFPESFQEKEWAGKPVHCRINLRSLSAPKLPELSDEFAKELNADSLDELKVKVRKGLEEGRDRNIREYVNEQLLGELLSKSTIHVADNLWEGVAGQRLQEIEQEQGKSIKDIADGANMTVEQLVQSVKDDAQLQVKRAAAIYEVFRKEEMKLGKEEIQREIVEFALDNNIAPEQVAQGYRQAPNFREQIDYMACFRKVLGFLSEHANLTAVANEPK